MPPGLASELTPAQAEQVKSFVEPIKFDSLVAPNKRHPLTNLRSMPTNYGFLTGVALNDNVYCQDYSIRDYKDKPAGGVSTVTTTLNNSQIEVSDYQVKRNYIFDHEFKNPQIERLGDSKIENGVYFILDKGDKNAIYKINDDIKKTNDGRGNGPHIEEEEISKSKVQIAEIHNIREIKRIGEYLMVTGTDKQDESKTRIIFIDREGKTIISQQVNFLIDRIVTNQKSDRENKFILVTTDKKVIIEELIDKDGHLRFGGENQMQAQSVGRVTQMRDLIDVAISGDEIALAVSETFGKDGNKKMISVVEKDGKLQIADKEVEKVTGIIYLNDLPYTLYKQDDALNATLIAGG